MNLRNRKSPKLYKGVLENSSLAEVAFFLKKAKQNIAYASMALEQTDFTSALEEVKGLSDKITLMTQALADVSFSINHLEGQMIREVARAESSEDEEV